MPDDYVTIRIRRRTLEQIDRVLAVVSQDNPLGAKPTRLAIVDEAFKALAEKLGLPWEGE